MRSYIRFRLLCFIPVLTVAGLLLVAGPAGATVVRYPVKVRMEGSPRAAEAGKPFEGVLVISAVDDVTLDGFFINTGRSWKLSGVTIPESLHLTKGEIRRIPFTVTSDDPTEPLHIEYQYGEESVRQAVDLSPAAAAAARPAATVAIADPGVLQSLMSSIDSTPRRAEALPARDRFYDHEVASKATETKDRPGATAAYNVRVFGFFNYRRMNDGAAVGVDGAVARVYDEDTGPDELLATQVLGPDGRLDVTFNWDPCFGCDGTPDLYVEFELENAETDVHDDSIWESDYTFETGVWQDFGGTTLDIGAQTPGDASLIPACHIMTNATRAWRFTADNGRDTPKVDYQWPDNDGCGACYDDGAEEIYIDSSRQWNENTIVHEFGHHFVNTFAVITPPSYCNGFCDSGSCGHCLWCRETDHDAFNEGFADYYQDVVMRTSITNPVTPARTYEVLQKCTDSGANSIHDPWRTEAIFAALLHDIEDSAQENEPNQPQGQDELNLGFDEIFWIVDQREPLTPADFVGWFKMDYPGLKEPFWATAINNGYQTDAAPPGIVTNITSDHTLNSNTDTRPNIKWFWNRASDDMSGIQAYSIVVQRDGPFVAPDFIPEVGDVTQFTSGPHTPGWYYISIRAQDRNGAWSNNYEVAGPYGIRAAEPANLKVKIHSNWDYLGVTARHVPDATESLTHAPSYLNGGGGTTYLSTIYNNSGEVATSVSQYWVSLFVDGYPQAFHHRITSLLPGVYDYVLNKPVTIAGGRHTIGVRLDDTDLMSEPDEIDNYWARQWAWDSPWFGLGAPSFVTSPPGLFWGTEWIVDGSAFYTNCGGFRAQDEVQNYPNNMWTAVTLHANDAADYDLDVYVPSTSPTDAFTSPNYVSGSYRGSNSTDAFLFNSWQYFGYPIALDYGILNYSGGNPGVNGFYLQKVTSVNLSFPGGNIETLNANEMLKLHQYYSPGGNVYARVQLTDPSAGQVYLTLVPQAFALGPLSSAGTTVVSDPVTGVAVINEPQAGYQCLAIWRDPTMGTGPLGMTVTISGPQPDLAMKTPPGWALPLVPRPAADGTPGGVPAPAFLLGDVAQTYLNYAVSNEGLANSPPVSTPATLYADGVLVYLDSAVWPAPGATTYRNLATPVQFRGGRHVLGIYIDSSDIITEVSNANNTTAGQWVWRPSTPSFDLTQPVVQPPDRFAGWNLMPAGSPLWFNMNALRSGPSTPSVDGWKVAVALMPDAGKDVDLKLFEAAPDAVTGFDTELASSAFGIDQMDFIIADFRVTSPRQFDAGFVAPIVQPGTGLAEFRLSKNLGVGPAAPVLVQPASIADRSRSLAATTGGTRGPFTIGAGDLFDLYEVDLPVGTYEVRLIPGTGSVDWGIAVYGPGQAFLSRSDALPGGTAWEAAAGAPEILNLTILEAGQHSVVVWKNKRADVNTSGTFTLRFYQQTTGVPGDGGFVAGRLIESVRPNPFAGSTQVEVRLTESSDVVLEVFDPSGRRLHREDIGRRDPGAYAFDWDGRDDLGQSVPAGIYFVRVTAGEESDGKKIVRVR